MRIVKWTFKAAFLLAITPFGVLLSFFPPFRGPREWFRFIRLELLDR